MRKKLVLVVAFLFITIVVQAGVVTEQQALRVAQKFMPNTDFHGPEINKARKKQASDNASFSQGYYIFNAKTGGGFVIVAGEDRMPSVLGYSASGRLKPESASCNVRWLLDYYDQVADSLAAHPDRKLTPRHSIKPTIRPLVTTTWGQSSPYNDLCPQLHGQTCVTGCVATAMAQVINYNRWPVGETSGVDAYQTGLNSINVPALEPTLFKWDNMSNGDVARLMRYCGQSVKMDYDVNESGASPVDEAPALIKVFGYSQTAHYVEDASYSADEWEDLLYNELAEMRPIVYNGWGSGGGHTFVVHGYDDGRFYINWGWDGYEDGFFVLTGLNTGIGDFNSTQSATIGIQPPGGNDTNRPSVIAKSISNDGSRFSFRSSDGYFKQLKASGSIVSDLAEQNTRAIGLGLYDDSGLLKVLWESQHDFTVDEEFRFEATFSVDSDVADGNYRVVPICRNSEGNGWQADANASDYYLRLTIMDNYLKIVACPMSEEDRLTNDVAVRTIEGITYYLYTYNGKCRAEILPAESGSYKGDVNIPDNISHEGTDYHVYKVDFQAFQNCMELTSLSAAVSQWPNVSNCPSLERLELREGVSYISDPITGCDRLSSVTFPKSLSKVRHGIAWCNHVKELRFNNTDLLTFEFFPDWHAESLPALTDIYFLVEEPPLFTWDTGEFKANPSVTIHVPEGAKGKYEASPWKVWKIQDDLKVAKPAGIEWGYCEGKKMTQQIIYDTVGDNDAEYAIHVPAELLEAYSGKTISQIQYYQADAEMEYVFITKPGTDYIVKQTTDKDLPSSWITIDLKEPYTITGDELYVGVGSHKMIEIAFSDLEEKAPDGFWFRFMGADANDIINNVGPGEWTRVSDQNENFNHPIPLRFIITGDNLPTDLELTNTVLKADNNEQYTFEAKVRNHSLDEVKKYTISWDFDGGNKDSKVFETSLPPSGSETVSISIPIKFTERNNNFNYAVTDINGEQDGVAANSTGTIIFNAQANTLYPRRVVMEEGTGTWCGLCVRGIETIDRLSKDYPDNFIAISLHVDDPMNNTENYRGVTNRFSGYPVCLINRLDMTNPRYPQIRPIVEEMKDKAEARVTATAAYIKRDSSAVSVQTESVFGFNDSRTADFRLAYVVLEDHVGPYEQSNTYAGATFDEETTYLEAWGDKPSQVLMEHNNVARGIYGGVNGLEGSVPTTIVEGETYSHEYSFVLPDNIQDKKNIRIVVLLINNKTGEIVNAGQTTVEYKEELNNMVFDFRKGYISLLDGDTVNCYGIKGNVMYCTTRACDGYSALQIQTFDGHQASGTAKLEILNKTLTSAKLTLALGETPYTPESIAGKTMVEKNFTTDSHGNAIVELLADNLENYGILEARLTVTIGSQAQTVNIVMHHDKVVVNNVTPQSDEAWWKNYDESGAREGMTFGNYRAGRNHAAIHVTADMGEGNTIDGFAFHQIFYDWVENVTVWLSSVLPEHDSEADIELIHIPNEQMMMNARDFYQVAFEQRHEIPKNGLYVGFSFDKTNPSYFPFLCYEGDEKGGCWLKADNNPRWTNLYSMWGNLKCQLLLGHHGETVPGGIIERSILPGEGKPFNVYDMYGRKVKNNAMSLDGLPKGLYIVNGKKIIK